MQTFEDNSVLGQNGEKPPAGYIITNTYPNGTWTASPSPQATGKPSIASGVGNAAVSGAAGYGVSQTGGGSAIATPQVVSIGGQAPVAAETATSVPGLTGSAAANVAIPVAGAVGMYDTVTHDRGDTSNVIRGAASGAAMGSPFGPPGMVVGGIVGAGAGYASKYLNTRSTKERQADRQAALYNANYSGQQDFIKWAQEQEAKQAANPTDKRFVDPNGIDSKVLQVQGKNVVVNPTMMQGENAPMEIVKDDYFGKWTPQQRYEYNKQLLDNDLYASKGGGWEITDKNAANQIKTSIDAMPLDPNWQNPQSTLVSSPGIDNAYVAPQPVQAPAPSTRSATTSNTSQADAAAQGAQTDVNADEAASSAMAMMPMMPMAPTASNVNLPAPGSFGITPQVSDWMNRQQPIDWTFGYYRPS